jgi:alginate O-acetyltransferase complex protein AlgI
VADSIHSIAGAEPSQTSVARNIAALLPVIALLAAAFLGYSLPPWQFMWLLAFALFFALKWATWLLAHGETRPRTRSFAYLFLWPGMDAESFLAPATSVAPPTAQQWLVALAQTLAGAALLWVVARCLPDIPLLRGWTGMLGAGLLLHFGSFRLVALFWRWRGIDARPIMDAPLRSTSLAEFWGRRWNLGFRDLAHTLLFTPAQRALGPAMATLVVFIFSGLIHDLVISVPARGGYGLPTVYFLLQASGLLFERSRTGRRFGLGRGGRGWLFTVVFVAAPACILFHPAFISRVFLPFMRAIGAL